MKGNEGKGKNKQKNQNPDFQKYNKITKLSILTNIETINDSVSSTY